MKIPNNPIVIRVITPVLIVAALPIYLLMATWLVFNCILDSIRFFWHLLDGRHEEIFNIYIDANNKLMLAFKLGRLINKDD